MKKLFVTLTLILTLCSANLSYAADRYVTLLKDNVGTTPLTQTVATDEVAVILRLQQHSAWGSLSITKGSTTFTGLQSLVPNNESPVYAQNQPFVVVGPCTITYTPHSGGDSRAMLTLKISPNPNIMGVKQ